MRRRRNAAVIRSALAACLAGVSPAWLCHAEEAGQAAPSPRAQELISRLDSKDLYERQVAFLRLEALREPATLKAVRPYLGDRDVEIRASAVRALAAIGGPAVVPTLLQMLRTDKHPRVRRAALLALEPLQPADPEILPAFLKALRDRQREVRMSAVDVVSRIDDPRAKDAIRVRYKRERDRDVRRVLDRAIQRVGQP